VLRKEVHLALNLLANALPARGMAFYVRRATPDGMFLRMAGDVLGLTGWTVQEWMARGGTWRAHVHADDLEKVDACLRDLSDADERTLEYRFLNPDGSELWVRDSLRAIPGAPGVPWEVVGVLRDASLERTLRSQVGALEERIWESQRMESLGALAGGVAHDFNNLLTTILTTINLLEQDAVSLGPAGRRDLRMIRDAADRGSGMVRQILRFVARREHQSGPVDVNRVVSDLEGILRRRLGLDVLLDLDLGEGVPEILSDAAQIEQVILNLAVNAREAMPAGGSVRLETTIVTLAESQLVEGTEVLSPGDYVRISVSDTGPGVPAALRERIFEPFFTTKNGAAGAAGFGLSTVQRIVRGHGGGIVVDRAPGGGAVFHVHLPMRVPSASEVAPEVAAVSLPEPVSGVRVLVVEDDPAVRELMRRSLQRDGHAVAAVGTAADALRAFDGARPPFDVVVIDVVLPDRTGPVLARALRRRLPTVGVVYASGYGEHIDTDREPGLFLTKPYTPAELQNAVQRALPRAPASDRQADLA
jgi:two-component system cell cycle sensor histidine kinase/response regulator CckA